METARNFDDGGVEEGDMSMDALGRRALLVGIDHYDHFPPLSGCVNDVTVLAKLLEKNEDGTGNFDCQTLLDPGSSQDVTRPVLRQHLKQLFDDFKGDILFYFSGHGHGNPTDVGGYLVTHEGQPQDPGVPMDELLTRAMKSNARSVLLILDCCYSGGLGDPAILQSAGAFQPSLLKEGLTILAASRSNQPATEQGGHGLFTRLVVEALKGGAADVRGLISAASIYGYVEQALNAWHQRPLYKSHAARLAPVRRCLPAVPDSLLLELPTLFSTADSPYPMDPSYEFTHPSAIKEHVEIFNKFKVLRDARLLTTEGRRDLYFVALDSQQAQLTPLGQFYWNLAKNNRIS